MYVDTITGKEFIDSTAIKKESKLKYPLLDDVTIGLNVWDPIVRAFGGDHGLVDIWAELSLYNRIKPVIELGIGQARHIPADSSYTYKSNVAPYFKVGVNYNFLFNKAKLLMIVSLFLFLLSSPTDIKTKSFLKTFKSE